MFMVTLALGVAVVAAIAMSPLYAGRLRPMRSARLGIALVLLAIGIATVCTAAPSAVFPVRHAVFLCVFVLMLAGALLILGEDPDDWREAADDEPPWWPEFEASLTRYRRGLRDLIPGR